MKKSPIKKAFLVLFQARCSHLFLVKILFFILIFYAPIALAMSTENAGQRLEPATAWSDHYPTLQPSCLPVQRQNRQKRARPEAWYATYCDPIFEAPIKVRYAPTKQEILDHDIQNFLNSPQRAALRATLFTRTLMHGTPQQTTALLAAQANPNSFDSSGIPPVHTATRYTNIPVLQLLLSAKADLDALDQQGNTVLHVAVQKENPALVYALLASGANTEIPDQSGLTALEYLERRKREYQDMQEKIIRDNEKFEQENGGQSLPTFQAVIENLQNKFDTLYTICAALERAEEKVEPAHEPEQDQKAPLLVYERKKCASAISIRENRPK